MADIGQMGAGLMQHIIAYIDDRLGYPSTGAGTETGDSSATSSATQTTGVESYIDPFNVNLTPLSLPLPDAFSRVVAVLAVHPADDHLIIRVSSHGWEDFYRRLLAASRQFPDFLDTAVNVQERFGFASSPALDLPELSVIRAGDGYAPLGGWVGRYDQVYTAVLVIRYTAGTVPTEFLT